MDDRTKMLFRCVLDAYSSVRHQEDCNIAVNNPLKFMCEDIIHQITGFDFSKNKSTKVYLKCLELYENVTGDKLHSL